MADRGSGLSGPRGPVVVVVGADTWAGAELAAGLDGLGVTVGSLDVAALDGRHEFTAALGAVAQRLGRPDGVVVASVGTPPTPSGAVAELEPDAWTARVELPLHRTLICFHGTLGILRAEGGSMVLLVPTLSLVGAAGFGPWAAVTEGQRALAKATARAWGCHAISVNCVAVPAVLLAPSTGGDRGGFSLHRPGQPPPSFGPPQMRVEVSGVVRSLLSPAWRPVTGATVAVDGGVWMTP